MSGSNRLLVLIIFTSVGCSREIEVPENKAAVVYSDKGIEDALLKTGAHKINFFSDTILYSIDEKKLDLKFDVMFNDATAADIDFSIQYLVKVDSLVNISRRYNEVIIGQNYPLSLILMVEARSQVRSLLMNSDKNIGDKQIFEKVKENLRASEPVNRIVEIKSFQAGQILYKH